MKISNNCTDIIKKYEGFSTSPYLCPAGIPTIGYGSTHYEGGRKVLLSDDRITEQRAVELLAYEVEQECLPVIERLVNVVLNQNQIDALVSFVYNVGSGNFEKSTLLKKINAKDFDGAKQEFLKWIRGGGKVLPGLEKRRKEESDLFGA